MKGIFSLAISLLIIGVFASALTGAPPPTDEPIIVLNRLIVQVSPTAGIEPPPTGVNMSSFGNTELDGICRAEGVSKIRPLFPGADPYDTVDLSRYYVVTFKNAKADENELDNSVRAFELSPYVESVERDALHIVSLTPNDTYYGNQWGLNGTWGVNAEDAWDESTGSPTVVVGIADTGVDYDHPDLNDDIWINTGDNNSNGIDDDGNGYIDDWCGWDFVSNESVYSGEDGSTPDNDPMDFHGHGTHCSGISAAETNNSTGVAGLGFDVNVMCLRIGWKAPNGLGYVGMSYAAEALYYAADMGAVSYNASWGSSNSGGLSAATTYAVNHGVQICKAAGNGGGFVSGSDYLANHADVICVASTTNQGKKSNFSSYGTPVDVSAPGSNIYSTIRQNYGAHTYAYMSGTSMATPHVVGLVGLCKSYDSGATRQEIRDAIEDSCRDLNNDSYFNDGYMGEGLIDANAALAELGGSPQNQPPGPFNLLAPTDGANITLPYTFDWEDSIDPDGNDIIYMLQYDDNAGFTSPASITGLTVSEHTFNDGYAGFVLGTTYYWKVRARDVVVNPLFTWSNQTWSFTINSSDADDENPGIPTVFSLSPAVPNPSNGNAKISYSLPKSTDVLLEVYDIRGRKVKTLVNGSQRPGYYDETITGLSSGIYIYRLQAGTFAATKKMIVVK